MSKNRFSELFARADAAFTGKYQKELDQLLGLSREEIDKIIPGTTDLKTYYVLIRIVDQASRENLSQSELVENIKKLGEVGEQIARKIPGLAVLL